MAGRGPEAPRPLIFGEILFDRFPNGVDVLGGAPFNVAWHLQAFGASPLMVSRIGNDPSGETVQTKMARWGMDPSAIQVDDRKPTGQVTVTFRGTGCHSFDIVDDQAYDHIAPIDGTAITEGRYAALYHGSLALRHGPNRDSLAALKAKTQAPVFIDINLRAPWWSKGEVLAWIRQARWAKLNDEELLCLTDSSGSPDAIDSIQALGHRFQDACDLDLLIVTRGAKGAMAFPRGSAPVTIEPSSNGPVVVDTVGAGDAFSAVLLLGLIQNWPLETTLMRAQDFASGIVGQRGGTVDEPDFYAGFRTRWGR